MPLTSQAANQSLQWADYVTAAALFTGIDQNGFVLNEVPFGVYQRQPVAFSPASDGVRYSTEVLLFDIPATTTVAWYALLDADSTVLAAMPNYTGNISNQPSPCFFIDVATGWIDAPSHGMSVGQQCIFLSGQSLHTNTHLEATHSAFGDAITYNTLSYSISAQGPFWIWTVCEIEDNRFRIVFYDGSAEVFLPSYAGWGYFQRLDQSVFDSGGGTLRIDSITLAEFG
jgi:hypothetical protein